jgi:coenzyme PQQ biosynthesis protein PqqD
VIALGCRPRLAAKARLRYDRKSERYLLLYPERGLLLNPTAAEIATLCDGERTVEAIVEVLTGKYAGRPRGTIEQDVQAFLATLQDRGLLETGP